MEKQEFSKAKKFSLAESITYADGAIVSKVLLKNDQGNLTLFAFDKGEMLREHTAPLAAMVQLLDGKAEIIIDKKSHILVVGESIIMPANVTHALTAVEKFKMLLTMIKG